MYQPQWEEVPGTRRMKRRWLLLLCCRLCFCICIPKSTSRRDLWFLADGDGEEIDVSAFKAELNKQMVPNMGKRMIVFCIGQQGSEDGSQDVIQPAPNRN